MNEQQSMWLCIPSGTTDKFDQFRLFNIRQIRMIDEIRKDHCRLWFSETHYVNVNGAPANKLVEQLLRKSVLSDGSPVSSVINPATPEDGPKLE